MWLFVQNHFFLQFFTPQTQQVELCVIVLIHCIDTVFELVHFCFEFIKFMPMVQTLSLMAWIFCTALQTVTSSSAVVFVSTFLGMSIHTGFIFATSFCTYSFSVVRIALTLKRTCRTLNYNISILTVFLSGPFFYLVF